MLERTTSLSAFICLCLLIFCLRFSIIMSSSHSKGTGCTRPVAGCTNALFFVAIASYFFTSFTWYSSSFTRSQSYLLSSNFSKCLSLSSQLPWNSGMS